MSSLLQRPCQASDISGSAAKRNRDDSKQPLYYVLESLIAVSVVIFFCLSRQRSEGLE
jgi:hypothetical protein